MGRVWGLIFVFFSLSAVAEDALAPRRYQLDSFPLIDETYQEFFVTVEEHLQAKNYAEALKLWNDQFYFELKKAYLPHALVEYPRGQKQYVNLKQLLQNYSEKIFLGLTRKDREHALRVADSRLLPEELSAQDEEWAYAFYSFSSRYDQQLEKDWAYANEEGRDHEAYTLAQRLAKRSPQKMLFKLTLSALLTHDADYDFAQALQKLSSSEQEQLRVQSKIKMLRLQARIDSLTKSAPEILAKKMDEWALALREEQEFLQIVGVLWPELLAGRVQRYRHDEISRHALLPQELLSTCRKLQREDGELNCVDEKSLSFVSPGTEMDGKIFYLITTSPNTEVPYRFPIPGLAAPSSWEMNRNQNLELLALSANTGAVLCHLPVGQRLYGHPYSLGEKFYPYRLVAQKSEVHFSSEYYQMQFGVDCSPRTLTLRDSPLWGPEQKRGERELISNLELSLGQDEGSKYYAVDFALFFTQHLHPQMARVQSILKKHLTQMPYQGPLGDKLHWFAENGLRPNYEHSLKVGARNLIEALVDDLLTLPAHQEVVVTKDSLNWKLRVHALGIMLEQAQHYFNSQDLDFIFAQMCRLLQAPAHNYPQLNDALTAFFHNYFKREVLPHEKRAGMQVLLKTLQGKIQSTEFRKLVKATLLSQLPLFLTEGQELSPEITAYIRKMATFSVSFKRLDMMDIEYAKEILQVLELGGIGQKLKELYEDLLSSLLKKTVVDSAYRERNVLLRMEVRALYALQTRSPLFFYTMAKEMRSDFMQVMTDPKVSVPQKELALNFFSSETALEDLCEVAMKQVINTEVWGLGSFWKELGNYIDYIDPQEKAEGVLLQATDHLQQLSDQLIKANGDEWDWDVPSPPSHTKERGRRRR